MEGGRLMVGVLDCYFFGWQPNISLSFENNEQIIFISLSLLVVA